MDWGWLKQSKSYSQAPAKSLIRPKLSFLGVLEQFVYVLLVCLLV